VLRTKNDLTKEALTKKIGARLGEPVSPGQILRWEKGENLPEVDSLMALAAEFGLSLEELVVGEEAFEQRVVNLVISRVEPRISRIEKHVGLSWPASP